MPAQHVFVLGGLAESLVNFRGPLLRELKQRGLRVTAGASGEDPAVANVLASWGIDYVPVHLQRAGLNPIKDAATVWSLTRTLKSLKPDVFLGYTIKPVVYGLLAARLANVPRRTAMLTGLGYAFTDGRENSAVGQVAKWLLRLGVSQSHMTVFQNPDDQAFMRRAGVLRPGAPTGVVNGSGVDLSHFAAHPLTIGPPTFLLIARLLRDKGIAEYVEAARRVKKIHEQTVFRLAGPIDPNPASFQINDIQDWKTEGVIEYLGSLDDVRPALASCHVYVLPSYREGTPRTVLEAMATGRAVITTDAPGCRETIVDRDGGFLVPVRNVEMLAQRMQHLVENPQEVARMATANRRRVEEKYDSLAVARATANLILG